MPCLLIVLFLSKIFSIKNFANFAVFGNTDFYDARLLADLSLKSLYEKLNSLSDGAAQRRNRFKS